MARKISHSLLDPFLTPLVAGLYRALHIPRWFPPEGIVVCGHLIAAAGAVGLAYSTKYWWCGAIGAIGVIGNHVADMVDGTHARRTGQCRNSGELLDHFIDPLSFSYWMVGLSISCNRLDLGLVAVLILYATALLTSIRAKIVGEFSLARFGPTEFKAMLTVYAVAIAIVTAIGPGQIDTPQHVALGWLAFLLLLGLVQLVINFINAVRIVNAQGKPPDSSDWQYRTSDDDSAPADPPQDERDV